LEEEFRLTEFLFYPKMICLRLLPGQETRADWKHLWGLERQVQTVCRRSVFPA